MDQQQKLVTIFGGSGFLGRYIARRMALAGWRVRVAVRNPNAALFVRTYGKVGQVEPIIANIRNERSVSNAMLGADVVVNCVGVLIPRGKQTFAELHAEGAARIAQMAAKEGVSRLVHISALGADAKSASLYSQSKAEGEAGVLAAFPDAVILRPSVLFGTEDDFFNRFATLARLTPVLPITAGETLLQPVFVDDVAAAAEKAVREPVPAGIYELGGPEVISLKGVIEKMLTFIQRKRIIINLPTFAARIQAFFMELIDTMTGGLIPAMLTRDQIRSLADDNVVADSAMGFDDLGITPAAMDEKLEDYLYCYRSYGQYADITASAKDMQA